MLAPRQMRVPTLPASNRSPQRGGNALPENRMLFVQFLLLVFSLVFFLKGVLLASGDGRSRNRVVGNVGRT